MSEQAVLEPQERVSNDQVSRAEALRSRYGEERLPRYTSYPTAPHFSNAVGAEIYADWLGEIAPDASGSLYLHVPFCRSMCWYCGCHTTITRRDEPIADYLTALRSEIETVAGHLKQPLRVEHVHFGGGTPTILAPGDFESLVELLRRHFAVAAGAEIAVEIDPRTLEAAMAEALGRAGVTRVSLGVQSFDPLVQLAINRLQSVEQTACTVEALRAGGIGGVNFDLIYGLPHQTVESCLRTVEACLAMRPDRLSVFGYAHVPSFKKHQRLIEEAALPDGPARHAQAEAIAGALIAAGYRRIGLDHYALPEDDLVRAQEAGALHRNFQGYTTDAGEVLIGFGASAIGRLPQGYVQNEVALGRYAERVQRGETATAKGYALTADDRLRAEVIERIMCDFAVDLAPICGRGGFRPESLLETPRLRALEADGLIRRDGTVVTVAEDARFLVRTVAAAFDAYLGASGRSHSRAV